MTDVCPPATTRPCADCFAPIDDHVHGNTIRCWACQAYIRRARARAYQAAWRARTRRQPVNHGIPCANF